MRSRADVFVWSVWGAMLVALLVCVALYGRNIPLAEDWLLVAPLTGHEPNVLSWLWEQNNEHRLPLSRLVLLALLKATGGDFRAGMVLNCVTVAAISAAMIVTARHIRGGVIRYTDAFFPIAFMGIGNWDNLMWGWQFQFVSSTALTCLLLLALVRDAGAFRAGHAAAIGAALVLMPLSGANGLVLAAVSAPWAAGYAAVRLRSQSATASPQRAEVVLLACALLSMCLVGAYFINYHRTVWYPPSPSRLATAKTALMFLAYGFGPAAAGAWPLAVTAMAVLLAIPAVALLRALVRTRHEERLRASCIAIFAAGLAVLAVAIGWGRAGSIATQGFPVRYVMLALPALSVAYFVWELYSPPRTRRWLQVALFVAVLALLPVNSVRGFEWRDWYLRGTGAVQRDIDAGVSSDAIARQHREFLLHWDEPMLASRIRMLRDSGIGPFGKVAPK